MQALAGLTHLEDLAFSGNQIVDVSQLVKVPMGLPSGDALWLDNNPIGGLGVGHVDRLAWIEPRFIGLAESPTQSCQELQTLIDVAGSPPVDLDFDPATPDTLIEGVHCTVR